MQTSRTAASIHKAHEVCLNHIRPESEGQSSGRGFNQSRMRPVQCQEASHRATPGGSHDPASHPTTRLRLTHLFVHEDVDDRVVDGRGLGEESGDGSQPGVELDAGMSRDQYGEGRVRRPADHERHDHHHHHAGHLPLGLPGGGQTTVRHLEETGTGNQTMK